MYYPLRLVYEAIELGMHTAKNKPLTKKEREEKRKKRREKQSARWTTHLQTYYDLRARLTELRQK